MIIKNKKLVFKGYCCNFTVDKNRDKFLKGSLIFQQQLPILYEHKTLIGATTHIKEDNFGVYVEFILHKNIENISNKKFSIGFKCLNSYYKNNIRYIHKAKILEISIVKNPAQINTNFY